MNSDTRQTLIGVVGLTAVEIVALIEGFNGFVMTAYFSSVIALVAPQTLGKLPWSGSGG